jgi:hypothetical protein
MEGFIVVVVAEVMIVSVLSVAFFEWFPPDSEVRAY